jgi:hypothetical protein
MKDKGLALAKPKQRQGEGFLDMRIQPQGFVFEKTEFAISRLKRSS